MHNLLYGAPASNIRKEWSRLHRILTRCFIDTGNLPDGFAWPIEPARA
jgi:hypothetical protein